MTTLTKTIAETPSQTFVLAAPAPVAHLPVPGVKSLAAVPSDSLQRLSAATHLDDLVKDRKAAFRGWAIFGGVVSAGLCAWGATEPIPLGLGVATAIGSYLLWGVPAKQRKHANSVLQGSIDALSQQLPVPPASASAEERVATAWLAEKLLRNVEAKNLTPEGRDYVTNLRNIAGSVDAQHAKRIRGLISSFLDESGEPRRYLRDIDILGETIRRLPADVRSRLLKVIEEPVKTAKRSSESYPSPWRAQAFDAAVEGNEFRYSNLVTEPAAANELSPLHPDRIRFEQINNSLDDQLRAHARAGRSVLFAKASLPPEMGEQQAFRLAAHYEALGYRAYLHPHQKDILLTICTANDIPDASSIESTGNNFQTTRLEG